MCFSFRHSVIIINVNVVMNNKKIENFEYVFLYIALPNPVPLTLEKIHNSGISMPFLHDKKKASF